MPIATSTQSRTSHTHHSFTACGQPRSALARATYNSQPKDLRNRNARQHAGSHERRIARQALPAALAALRKEALCLCEQRIALRVGLAGVLVGDELRHERVERLAQLNLGLERLGDPVDRRERARDEGEGRGEGDGARAEEGAQLIVDLLGDILGGAAGGLVAEEAHEELADHPDGRRVRAGLEEARHLEALHDAIAARGDLLGVGGGRTVEQPKGDLAHALHRRLRQRVHHAKVVEHDAPARRDAHVARMRVAVQHARLHQLQEEGVEHLLAELLPVEAERIHLGRVGHLDALDVLHREHLLGRRVVEHLWHHHVRPRADERLGELLRVLALVDVVDLLVQQLGRLLVDVRVRPVGAVRLRVELVEQLDEHLEVLQVRVEQLAQARPLHLDRHRHALVHGAVNLPERRRGNRLLLERVEDLLDRRAELPAHDLHRLCAAKAGHVVLQVAQHLDVLLLEHVGPRRHNLPELDERRPQLEEGVADELCGGRLRGRGRLRPALGLRGLEHLERGRGEERPDLERPLQRRSLRLALPPGLHLVAGRRKLRRGRLAAREAQRATHHADEAAHRPTVHGLVGAHLGLVQVARLVDNFLCRLVQSAAQGEGRADRPQRAADRVPFSLAAGR
mmetsp:Transcript_5606/g.16812  ORF Transcript_5606/g.16812 Transcript_5606/m.16812 type:complete len:625 (-) Transcript_5606:259-2133(-)